ncbi:hypothetical protein QYE76_001438 [Lolium multiflorum]|uniref:Reverse transcriptase domain-containing protein n=1 Tax=Lolium multiflorum TaxID=4521 RepID=A0AAD8VZD1_LOLMU|nr:hypothetical protein QYE76_001438 [Lolium multiflorum]
MLKCPIHELPGNVIIDNFYARLSFQDKTLLDTSCSGSFTRKNEEFKRDLLDRIQENTEGWENDKDRESGIIYDYKCIEAFMDTDKFRNMSATYGLDSQVVANLYKAFASHYELPKKNFDKYHEPYKDKIDSSVNKCVVVETVDNVIPEAYIEKTPFPAKMKEYSVISSAVNKSEKKPKEPEEQIKIEPAVAIVKDLVTENVEDGHIIFCEDASNIVSHPNKSKQVSVPMLSVRIGDHCYYGLCDIGASVSAIPYELYTEIMHEIGSCELEDIDVVIHLANRETISPIGIVRDVEVLCGKIKYPADFLVLGSAASDHCPIIFGRPFLNTCGAIIDCKKEKILTRFAGEPYEFNFSKFTKTPYKADLPSNDFKMEQCASIVLVPNNPLQQHLENSESEAFRKERDELEEIFLRQPILKHDLPVEDLGTTPPPKEDPVFDLKPLPDNLKYAHIDDKKIYPVIISSKLSEIEEERLLEILKKHRGAIGYTLDDLKGISPSICQHAINMEDDAKPVVEHQRRLIPKMKEVVRNEVLKLLEAGIIYPIADSRWVSPVHCVPKKGGMNVVPNDNDELIPQRIVVGYRMCIDFRKVNKVTKKDHYPLPFIDQMLERCMSAIFHGFCESIVEVFMDDFSVYGNSFDNCLRNLDKVLQRCEETNLVLNWEKCHFMVNEGIVLGHKISERGIEVDRAKVEAIEKMPYPRDVKDRKGADNPVADNLSRLENIAYDPVPVNDSFPNEQLAVIKVSSRESPCTMVSNNKDKEPLKENIQDPELKKEDAREDEEEVEEAPQEHQQATVASIGVISNPSNIKRSARIATGGAVPRHYLAPRTSSPSNYNPYRNLIYDRQTERTPKVVLPSNWDIDRSDIAGEMKSEAEGWGNNSKSWNSPPDMIMSRVEHNSEMIRNLTSRSRRSPQIIAIDPRLPKLRHCTRSLYHLANVASNLASNLRRPTAPSDPLGEYDQEKMVIFDIKLMVGFGCDTIPILKVPPQYPKWMEPYVQTETYDLENGGSLVFERDLYLVSERLERPPPKFHGVRIHNTPTGEQQWMITADLKGSSEPPISERILFSFKAYSWVDGLAHALQEGLARVCGQNIAALQGSRFAHFARHDTMGEPMALSSHPVLKIHVQHLDFMLHETRKDLELTRVHSHRAQMALAHHADAIRLLAKDRRSLRLQRAKNVATITRLREKIRTLEVTVRTQQDQIQEMEEDGEDIQGGDDFLSDDDDFEDDEFTDEEDYEFLEAAEDGIIPIDVDEDPEE